MGDWPLIALNQYVWLRLCGTYADGSAYTREIWSAPTAFTNPDWIADRFFTAPLPADELNALQDGSDLELVFKAALGQSTVESEAVEFPVRTYMIKAIEDVRPEITGAEDSKGNEILPGGTTGDTSITLEGTAALGQEVEIFDGATSTGKKPKADDKGMWTVELTGLTRTKHVFKAKALYGSGTESGEWTVTVVDLVDLVEDFKSYPQGVTIQNPGDVLEGTNTKVTVITHISVPYRSTIGTFPYGLGCNYSLPSFQNKFEYSVALKQGIAKSAIIKGSSHFFFRCRVDVQFLRSDSVISSMLLLETYYQEPSDYEKEVAPSNGQAFDAIKFVMTPTVATTYGHLLRITTIDFKS
ncbi:hypothetical protein EMIT093MI4_310003 [Pseudomonas sp. IT-93MI4]